MKSIGNIPSPFYLEFYKSNTLDVVHEHEQVQYITLCLGPTLRNLFINVSKQFNQQRFPFMFHKPNVQNHTTCINLHMMESA